MAFAIPTVEELYASSMKFSRCALEAIAQEEHMMVSLYACAAIEHITKSCLTNRHPSLLVDLTTDKNWKSLRALVGFPDDKSTLLWTIGIEKALSRLNDFITSKVNLDDLLLLVAVRNGVVHIGRDHIVEESMVIAFVEHIDACILDLSKDRSAFWGPQLEVVDAMLAETSNRIEGKVALKLARGRATFEQKYGHLASELQEVLRNFIPLSESAQETFLCPACESLGVATGRHKLEAEWDIADGEAYVSGAYYEFSVRSFDCRTCGLGLDGQAEIVAANMPLAWVSDRPPTHEDDDDWDRE